MCEKVNVLPRHESLQRPDATKQSPVHDRLRPCIYFADVKVSVYGGYAGACSGCLFALFACMFIFHLTACTISNICMYHAHGVCKHLHRHSLSVTSGCERCLLKTTNSLTNVILNNFVCLEHSQLSTTAHSFCRTIRLRHVPSPNNHKDQSA